MNLILYRGNRKLCRIWSIQYFNRFTADPVLEGGGENLMGQEEGSRGGGGSGVGGASGAAVWEEPVSAETLEGKSVSAHGAPCRSILSSEIFKIMNY